MSAFALLVGLSALAFVGLGFFWVVRVEYSLGWQWWYLFACAGLLVVLCSLFVPLPFLSALLGAAGASGLWGSTELRAQSERARRGWYPSKDSRRPLPPLWSRFSRFRPPKL